MQVVPSMEARGSVHFLLYWNGTPYLRSTKSRGLKPKVFILEVPAHLRARPSFVHLHLVICLPI